MADSLGFNFTPDLANRFKASLNSPTGASPLPDNVGQALQVLSLHLPAFAGGSPIAPDALLNSSAPFRPDPGFPSPTGPGSGPAGPGGGPPPSAPPPLMPSSPGGGGSPFGSSGPDAGNPGGPGGSTPPPNVIYTPPTTGGGLPPFAPIPDPGPGGGAPTEPGGGGGGSQNPLADLLDRFMGRGGRQQ